MDNKDVSRREFIRNFGAGIGGLTLLSGFSIHLIGCSKNDYDVIIEKGLITDGSGDSPYEADIAIKGDRIAEIGDLSKKSAAQRINAAGFVVAPGFIDIHTHTDIELLVNPRAESKIRQGVTIEMSGQCGGSVAPATAEMIEKRNERLAKEYGLTAEWQDFNGFYQQLSKQGMALNWSTMIGQGNLRECVIGMSDRKATEADINKMKELAVSCMQQGAWGISTGLEYTPGSFADTDELIKVCSILQEMNFKNGMYATHMRNEDDEVEAAVQEALTIGDKVGTRIEISHLKASGKRNWYKVPLLLQMIEEAQKKGLAVTADRYPYSAYSTGLSALYPLWSREGGDDQFIQRLDDAETIRKIRQDVQKKIDRLGSWEAVLISGVHEEKNKWMEGKRMSEIASELNQNPFQVASNLIIEEKNEVSMCGFGMSEENTKMILSHPSVTIGSDGNSLSNTGKLAEGHPHPRAFGTFPRVLGKYSREEKLFPVEEAVRKMTSLPASILGIKERGLLQPGYFADVVVFNPDTVEDTATWDKPKQYPKGIPFVMVNGQFAIFESEHTNKLPGRVLKRS